MKYENYKICHYHIFKNAGTSLDKALQKHFGSNWSAFEGIHAHDIKSNQELMAFLSSHPDIKAVSSHLCRPTTPLKEILPIVFLRDPLARARSVYEFTRLDKSQPFRESALGTFSDYLTWALSGAPGGLVIRSYQVVHLSSASFCPEGILFAIAAESHFEEAIQLLKSWPVIGIVEQYARSIKLIEKIYQNYFPDLTLTYEHENITSTGNNTSKIREEIGEGLFNEFNKQNKFDYQLYEFACQRLNQLCKTNEIL